jgi:chromosome segregation ATPase
MPADEKATTMGIIRSRRLLSKGLRDMTTHIQSRKTGREIKAALQARLVDLQKQLDRRNRAIDALLQDPHKARAYQMRLAQKARVRSGDTGLLLRGQDELSQAEQEQIAELSDRITAIEGEMHRLRLMVEHLDDDQVFELTADELRAYGFELARGA